MPRTEAVKISQKKYYEKNKTKINKNLVAKRNKGEFAEYMRTIYDDRAKEKKKLYYLKNRNYKNKDFSKDLINLFEIV